MTHQGILNSVLVVALMVGTALWAADGRVLVFKNGSTMDVVSATVNRGSVVIKLANGQIQQFETNDIDLEASGLVQQAAQSSKANPKKWVAPKLTMPDERADAPGLTISDQDVRHVRPSTGGDQGNDDGKSDEDDEETPSGPPPLRVSGVTQSTNDNGVTVSGTVTNDGIFDLEQTTITGVALDADGKTLGQGSVGLASVLGQGASRKFSLIIPVTGEVDSVKVGASAAEKRPRSQGSDTSPSDRGSQKSDQEETPEDENPADAG
jgi:hypothetical protein